MLKSPIFSEYMIMNELQRAPVDTEGESLVDRAARARVQFP